MEPLPLHQNLGPKRLYVIKTLYIVKELPDNDK